MPLKDQLTLPTVNDAIAVRPLSLPVPPGTTERRNLRTERSKTFAHDEKAPDGKEIRTFKTQLGAVCYRDDTGELRSIDTTIRNLGTHIGVEWAPYKFRLHETGIGFDFESREGGQCTVTLTGIGGEKFEDSIKPEVSENVITYRDVRPGCDIVFKCLNEQVKTLRILRDDKAPRTFDWSVTSDKPELIDSTLTGTDANNNQLSLSSEVEGDVIHETWNGMAFVRDVATRVRTPVEVSYPVAIDPTINATISNTANDGYEYVNYGWTSTANYIMSGKSSGGNLWHGAWTFASIAIANASTIDAATLTFNVVAVHTSASCTLYGQAIDNASVFSAGNLPHNATKTTANTAVSIPSGGSKDVTCTSIIQEIVNRAGWASGNSLNLILFAGGSNDRYAFIEDMSWAGGTAQASLSITYTAAAGGTAANLLLLGCG